ncbi:MAG: hypothetical protein ACR2LQ_05300 [Acidimicrobiales bacterium]
MNANSNPNAPRRKPQQQNRRRRQQKAPERPADMWRPVAPPPEPKPIVQAGDPTALIRSLGHPPLPGQGTSAELSIATVVERSAQLATALAMSAGLLAEPGH